MTNMETLLDINPFLLIAAVFGVLVLLVIIVGNLPIKMKERKMPPRRRSSGQSWFSKPYPEGEAWRKYPGFSSTARENRRRWIEKQERKMYGC